MKYPKRKDVQEFLRKEHTMTISSVTKEGKPQSATVYYVLGGSMNMYFVTKEDSRKYRNITNNPKVSVVVSDCDQIQTAQIEGIAEEIKMGAVFTKTVDRIIELTDSLSHYWEPPIGMLRSGKAKLIKVTPTWIRYIDYKGVSNEDGMDRDFTYEARVKK